MKIVHITDTHIAGPDSAEAHNARRLVAHIVEHHSDAVVVHTGDVVDSPEPAYFDLARDILRPLVDHCRLLLVAPGNHDVEWHGTLGLVRRFRWRDFRADLTRAEAGYPYCDTVGGVQLTLIDTTAEAGGVEDLAEGRVGYIQRQELAHYLELGDPHTRVVAGHHHLYCDDVGNELLDAAELRALCAGRVDLYLMGHDHHWGQWREVDGIGWIADGGKSTRPHAGRLRYRVFDIRAGAIDVELERIPIED